MIRPAALDIVAARADDGRRVVLRDHDADEAEDDEQGHVIPCTRNHALEGMAEPLRLRLINVGGGFADGKRGLGRVARRQGNVEVGKDGLGAQPGSGDGDGDLEASLPSAILCCFGKTDERGTYTGTGMRACADKVGALDAWMARLRAEREDIKEIVRDAEDGSVGEVELFFPFRMSAGIEERHEMRGRGRGGPDVQVSGVLTSSHVILSLSPVIPNLASMVSITCRLACSTNAGQSCDTPLPSAVWMASPS